MARDDTMTPILAGERLHYLAKTVEAQAMEQILTGDYDAYPIFSFGANRLQYNGITIQTGFGRSGPYQ